MEISLLIVFGSHGDTVCYHLDSDETSIGRGPDNHIQVGEDTVSSRHCKIERTPDGHSLRDAGSRNGTRVNGIGLSNEARVLRDGDEIMLGKAVRLKFLRARSVAGMGRRLRGSTAELDGTTTRIMKAPNPSSSSQSSPGINPVAAAVAKAAEENPGKKKRRLLRRGKP